jgi:hypothetical protein
VEISASAPVIATLYLAGGLQQIVATSYRFSGPICDMLRCLALRSVHAKRAKLGRRGLLGRTHS